jgi:acyl dehydratase
LDLSLLVPGQGLIDEDLLISPDVVAAYRGAVGDGATLYRKNQVVPPMAVAALAMAAAMRAVELPKGAVHTGQELEFIRPVTPNTPLRCSVRVGQNSVRRGTRFLTLLFDVASVDSDGLMVATGRATIAVPEITAA